MCGFNKKRIKDQVLSIAQVQELIELGFDVRKYATSAVIEAKDGNHYIVDRRLLSINMGFMETEVIAYFETLSIGDIMDILPKVIPILDTAKSHIFSFLKSYVLQTDMKTYLKYKYEDGNNLLVTIESTYFINMLFDTLKWCIINKHIQCQ